VRAATVIVGSIAFSSCLIALAFLLSGGNGPSTRTADPTHRPAPTAESRVAPERTAGAAGEPTECSGGESSFSVVGVSCEVGAQVDDEYRQGTRGTIVVKDAASGEVISFTCEGTAPAICNAEGGASVYLAPVGGG
jgi:hypothetical protein